MKRRRDSKASIDRARLALLSCAWILAGSPKAPAQVETKMPCRYRAELSGIRDPCQCCIDSAGDLFVVESGEHRIQKLGPKGETLLVIGGFGAEPGRFHSPQGLALDQDDSLWVADTLNHRVQRITAEGEVLACFGGRGREEGRFNEPCAIAVHGDRVCVADCLNDRVQVFDRDGHLVRVVGGFGSDAGRLLRPKGVCIDALGRLWVADTGNDRLQCFDADGALVGTFGRRGLLPGFFSGPTGLSSAGSLVFVADTGNQRVQVFGPDGAFLREWGVPAVQPHVGAGRLHEPSHVAVAADVGRVLVSERLENRCQIFETGDERAELQSAQSVSASEAHLGSRIAVSERYVVVAEQDSGGGSIYDRSQGEPVLVHRFGAISRRFGEHRSVDGVSFLADGRTFVVCNRVKRLLCWYRIDPDLKDGVRYSPTLARLVKTLDFERRRAELPEPFCAGVSPLVARVHPDGELHVLDERSDAILVLDASLEFVRSYGGVDAGLCKATDFCFDSAGMRTFVVDSGGCAIVAFDRDGKVSGRFGERGAGPGRMREPFGIAREDDDGLLVTDTGGDRIERFTMEGKWLDTIGDPGMGPAQFFRPRGIDVDAVGRAWVADFGNHRVQVLDGEGRMQAVFGARLFVEPALRMQGPGKGQ